MNLSKNIFLTIVLWSFSFVLYFVLGDQINGNLLRSILVYTSILSIVINIDPLGANNSIYSSDKIQIKSSYKLLVIPVLVILLVIYLTLGSLDLEKLMLTTLLFPISFIAREAYLRDDPLILISLTSFPVLLVLIFHLASIKEFEILTWAIIIGLVIFILIQRRKIRFLQTKQRLFLNIVNLIISSRFEILILIIINQPNLSSNVALIKLTGVSFAFYDLIYGRTLPNLISNNRFKSTNTFIHFILTIAVFLGVGLTYWISSNFLDLVDVDFSLYLLLALSMTFSSLTLLKLTFDPSKVSMVSISIYSILNMLSLTLLDSFDHILIAISIINLALFFSYYGVKRKKNGYTMLCI